MRSVTDNNLFQKIISTSTVNKILCVSVLGVVIYGLKIFFGRDISYIHDCEGVTKTIKELVCGLFKKSSKAEQKVIPTEIEEKKAPKTKKEEPKVVPRIEQKVPATKEEEATEKTSILVSPAVVPVIVNQTILPEEEKTETLQEETELAKIKEDKTSNTKEEVTTEAPQKIEEDKGQEEEKKVVPKIEKAEALQGLEAPKIEELEEEKAEVDGEVVSESKPNPLVMSPREPSAEYQKSIKKIDQEMEQYTSRWNIESCHWENDKLNVILNRERPGDTTRVCQAFCVNSSFLSYSGQLHDRHKPTVSNPEFLSSSTLYSTSSIHPEQPERAALQATHL